MEGMGYENGHAMDVLVQPKMLQRQAFQVRGIAA